MASLYDDIEVTKAGGASKWAAPASGSSSFSMMQSHMAARKQTTQARSAAATRTAKPAAPTLAPVLDLGRPAATAPPTSVEGEYRFNQQTGRLEKVAVTSASPFIGDPTLCLGVTDEYNPLYPNDYEDVSKRLKEEKRAKARVAAVSDEPRQLVPRRYDSDSEEDEEEDEEERRKEERKRRSGGGGGGGGGGAAIAPPPSLVEDSGPPPMGPPKESKDPGPGPLSSSLYGINSVAAKMMAKMGYREGQGLGREGQGMSTALTVEKTSRRGGKIIHEKDERFNAASIPRAEVGNIDALLRKPSKVVLLRNMVGPGEVDDDLQPETAEECGKYGPVANVMIYEMPNTTEDEAVRIFVEFETVESAKNAIMDLNGRFFGGRVVKATFYDLERFINLELADIVSED